MVKAKSRLFGHGRQFTEPTKAIAIGAVGMLRTRTLPEADEFPYEKFQFPG